MDQYFLERHYQRLEEAQSRSSSPCQPGGPSPTRRSPVGKARSEPNLAGSSSTKQAQVGPAPPTKTALLQGGIKQANKAAWSKTLGKEGNPVTHSDAIARTSHVQVSTSRTRRNSQESASQSRIHPRFQLAGERALTVFDLVLS